ncbi:MAG: hypothetical protein AAFX96_08735, partial [Pseudomonadota bacterium]
MDRSNKTAAARRTMATSQEESAWEEAASQNRIVLSNVDVTDKEEFNELCGLLGASGVAAKSRLRTYIQQLQPAREQRQQQQLWHNIYGTIERNRAVAGGPKVTVNKVNYDREATLAKRIRLLPPDETNDFLKLQVQKIPLLSPTEQETVLYFKRSGLGDLFQRLVNPVDENGDYENISLIGNPGSGKSNLLWWVAHHLANTKKQTVLWLGRRLTSGNFTVRLFEVDETSGQSSIVEIHNAPSTVKDIMSLQIMSKVNVVILDALTTVKSHTEAVGEQALAWALEDRKNRRVIHSSSLRAFSLDDRILEEKHLVNLRMRPWTRPDYVESMADPDLKAQVCRTVNLAPNEVSNEEVVDSKLFYCGINARWFFNYSVDKIK